MEKNNKNDIKTNKICENNIEIKKMTIKDLEEIKENIETDFDEFWEYKTLQNELQSSNSKYIVAKNKYNNIVGFAGIKTILDESELMNIVVKKDQRGKKISIIILDEIIKIAKSQKIKKINLEVKNTNTIAINLYKKYNFIEVGLRKKYYQNEEDAILMTLKI